MAKKKTNATKATTRKKPVTNEWFRNALSSMGSIGKDVVASMAPSISSFVDTTSKTATNLSKDIKKGNISQKKIIDAIKKNPYMESVSYAFNAALEDLKSGKFANDERAGGAMDKAFGMDEKDLDFGDFSFDDSWGDDDSSGNNVTVNNDNDINNIQNGVDISSLNMVATNVASAQVKSTEALSNSLVAVMSSSMMQNREIGDSIISGIDAISQNTAQLVSYTSDSLQKFIDASIEYYSRMAPEEEDNKPDNSKMMLGLSAYDGNKFNVSQYIDVVKAQTVKALESTAIGSAAKMFTGEMGKAMLASPISMIASMVIPDLVPRIIRDNITKLDNAFADFIPAMLSKISGMRGNGGVSGLIGQIFGTRAPRTTEIEFGEVSRKAAVFDGITYNTINEIIPKHLRGIEAALTGEPEAIFDRTSGKWTTVDALRDNFVGGLHDNVVNTFKQSAFGKEMESYINNGFLNRADKKVAQNILEELYLGIERSNSHIDRWTPGTIDALLNLKDKEEKNADGSIKRSGFSKTYGRGMETFFIKALEELSQGGMMSIDRARLASQVARESGVQNLMQDPEFYNGTAVVSQFKGNLDHEMESYHQRSAIKRFGAESVPAQVVTERANLKLETSNILLNDIKTILLRGINVKIIKGRKFGNDFSYVAGGSGTSSVNSRRNNTGTSESLTSRLQDLDAIEETADIADENDSEDERLRIRAGGLRQSVNSGWRSTDNVQSSMDRFRNPNEYYYDESQRRYVRIPKPEYTVAENASAHVAESLTGIMYDFVYGDGDKVFKNIGTAIIGGIGKLVEVVGTNVVSPIKMALFGTKNENGFSEGGAFSEMQNKVKDTFNDLVFTITGKPQVMSDGTVLKDDNANTSVFSQIKTSMKTVADDAITYLFGPKEALTDEDGNPVVDSRGRPITKRSKTGIFSTFTEDVSEGFNDFNKSLFGERYKKDKNGDYILDENGNKILETFGDRVKQILPNATVGAVAGAGFLGTLFGGPLAGAAIGALSGIVSSTDKFKNWFFGEMDPETEERAGGFISKETQEFFKKNKTTIVGGAAIGTLKGLVFPGLLGNIIGGPLAGAAMGAGLGILKSSETVQSFLFGPMGEDGQRDRSKGFATKIHDKAAELGVTKKGVAMGTVGALGTSILGAGLLPALFGPASPFVYGIMGGLAGIATQSDKFKNYVFGELDEETGKREGGLIQRFARYTDTQIFTPIKDKLDDTFVDLRIWFDNKIGARVIDAIAPIGDYFRDTFGAIKDKFVSIGEDIQDFVNNNIIKRAAELFHNWILTPFKKLMKPVSDAVLNLGKKAVESPFNFLGMLTGNLESRSKRKAIKEAQLRADNPMELVDGELVSRGKANFAQRMKNRFDLRFNVNGARDRAYEQYSGGDLKAEAERKAQRAADRQAKHNQMLADRAERAKENKAKIKDYNDEVYARTGEDLYKGKVSRAETKRRKADAKDRIALRKSLSKDAKIERAWSYLKKDPNTPHFALGTDFVEGSDIERGQAAEANADVHDADKLNDIREKSNNSPIDTTVALISRREAVLDESEAERYRTGQASVTEAILTEVRHLSAVETASLDLQTAQIPSLAANVAGIKDKDDTPPTEAEKKNAENRKELVEAQLKEIREKRENSFFRRMYEGARKGTTKLASGAINAVFGPLSHIPLVGPVFGALGGVLESGNQGLSAALKSYTDAEVRKSMGYKDDAYITGADRKMAKRAAVINALTGKVYNIDGTVIAGFNAQLKEGIKNLPATIKDAFDVTWGAIMGYRDANGNLIPFSKGAMRDLIRYRNMFKGAVKGFLSGVSNVLNALGKQRTGLIGLIKKWGSKLNSGMGKMFGKDASGQNITFTQGISNAVNTVKNSAIGKKVSGLFKLKKPKANGGFRNWVAGKIEAARIKGEENIDPNRKKEINYTAKQLLGKDKSIADAVNSGTGKVNDNLTEMNDNLINTTSNIQAKLDALIQLATPQEETEDNTADMNAEETGIVPYDENGENTAEMSEDAEDEADPFEVFGKIYDKVNDIYELLNERLTANVSGESEDSDVIETTGHSDDDEDGPIDVDFEEVSDDGTAQISTTAGEVLGLPGPTDDATAQISGSQQLMLPGPTMDTTDTSLRPVDPNAQIVLGGNNPPVTADASTQQNAQLATVDSTSAQTTAASTVVKKQPPTTVDTTATVAGPDDATAKALDTANKAVNGDGNITDATKQLAGISMKAPAKGKTYQQLKQDKDDDEKEEEAQDVQKEIRDTLVNQTKRWDVIFSKKGLITGAVTLLLPALALLAYKIKKDGLLDTVVDGAKATVNFIKEKGPMILDVLGTVAEATVNVLSWLGDKLANIGEFISNASAYYKDIAAEKAKQKANKLENETAYTSSMQMLGESTNKYNQEITSDARMLWAYNYYTWQREKYGKKSSDTEFQKLWKKATQKSKDDPNHVLDEFVPLVGHNYMSDFNEYRVVAGNSNSKYFDQSFVNADSEYLRGTTRSELDGGTLSTRHTTENDSRAGGDGRSSSNGRGGVAVNDFNQKSAKWNTPEYASLHIDDAGCGPTAAATALSAYGVKSNPVEASIYSINAGERDDDGGTRPEFFEKYGNTKGVQMHEGENNTNLVAQSISNKKPVILMGQGADGDVNSPFGSTPHYVVGNKIDGNTISISDPLTSGEQKYNINNVMSDVKKTIYTGSGGLGGLFSRVKNKISRYGKGSELDELSGPDIIYDENIILSKNKMGSQYMASVPGAGPSRFETNHEKREAAYKKYISEVNKIPKKLVYDGVAFKEYVSDDDTDNDGYIYTGKTGVPMSFTGLGPVIYLKNNDSFSWTRVDDLSEYKTMLANHTGPKLSYDRYGDNRIMYNGIYDTAYASGVVSACDVRRMQYRMNQAKISNQKNAEDADNDGKNLETLGSGDKFIINTDGTLVPYTDEALAELSGADRYIVYGNKLTNFDRMTASMPSSDVAKLLEQTGSTFYSESGEDYNVVGTVVDAMGQVYDAPKQGYGHRFVKNKSTGKLMDLDAIPTSEHSKIMATTDGRYYNENGYPYGFVGNGTVASFKDTNKPSVAQKAREELIRTIKEMEGRLDYSMGAKTVMYNSANKTWSGATDCSGLMNYLYKRVCGMNIGADTVEQINNPQGVVLVARSYEVGQTIDSIPELTEDELSTISEGDLIFYGDHNANPSRANSQYVSHVEMYIGNGQMMGHGGGNSGHEKGPKVHKFKIKFGNARFIAAKRFLDPGHVDTIYTNGVPQDKNGNAKTDGKRSGSLFETISKFFIEFVSRAVTGITTGDWSGLNDWSEIFGTTATSSSSIPDQIGMINYDWTANGLNSTRNTTFPAYATATVNSGISNGVNLVSNKLTPKGINTMLNFVDPIMAQWETGSYDLSDSAYTHAAVDSNDVVALGTRGYNGILAKEVLDRIANAPDLSDDEKSLGHTLGVNANTTGYYGTTFGTVIPEIQDYMASHIGETRNVQDALSEAQLSEYFEKPLSWYDQGILTDPRSIALIGQFGGYGPAHIGRMFNRYSSELKNKSLNTDDLTNTLEVMKKYYRNPTGDEGGTYYNKYYDGHLNRFTDFYNKLNTIPESYFIKGAPEPKSTGHRYVKTSSGNLMDIDVIPTSEHKQILANTDGLYYDSEGNLWNDGENGKGGSGKKITNFGKGFKLSNIKYDKKPSTYQGTEGTSSHASYGKGSAEDAMKRVEMTMNENHRRSSSLLGKLDPTKGYTDATDLGQLVSMMRSALDYLSSISTATRDTADGIDDLDPTITNNYTTTNAGDTTIVKKSSDNGNTGVTPGMSKNEQLARKIAHGTTRVISYA